MSRSWIRHGLLGSAVLIGIAGAAGSLRTGDLPGNGDSWGLAVSFVSCALLGWIVTGRRRELPIGWLLLAGGTIGTVAFLASWWAYQTLVAAPGSMPGGPVAAWLSLSLSALPWPLVLVAPLVLFPSGRVRSRRWFWFATAVAAIFTATATLSVVVALPVAARHAVELLDAPGIAGSTTANAAIGLQAFARLIALAAAVVGLFGLIVARSRAHADDRRPYTTALVGAAVVIGVFAVDVMVPAVTGQRVALPEAVGALAILAMPAALAIAVVRFEIYELRALINRSALVVLTGAMLAAVYLGVLTLVTVAIGDSTRLSIQGVLAGGAVVVLSVPVAAIATRMTRRSFGRAGPPGSMASRFAEQLPVDGDPLATARALAETMRAEMRLGSVALNVVGLGNTIVGEPNGPATNFELSYGPSRVGEVIVTARHGESLGAADVRMLRDVAGYVSIAVEAIRIGEDLRRAQHALESAQSEERRRVRRDLHDDVGPTLASARLKLAALRRRLPDGASVDDIIDQLAGAIRGIRQVVDGLHPSVLEDVGLVSALQILLTDIRLTTGMYITFDPPSSLPDLPAATAGTAYRVAAEALTNVVRHSQATSCTLRIDHHQGMLHIEVADNGRGFDTSTPTGMGLRNMLNRATLAKGVATVSSTLASGTTVVLDVPV